MRKFALSVNRAENLQPSWSQGIAQHLLVPGGAHVVQDQTHDSHIFSEIRKALSKRVSVEMLYDIKASALLSGVRANHGRFCALAKREARPKNPQNRRGVVW